MLSLSNALLSEVEGHERNQFFEAPAIARSYRRQQFSFWQCKVFVGEKTSFVVPALAGLLRPFPPKGGTTNVSSWLQNLKMRIAVPEMIQKQNDLGL